MGADVSELQKLAKDLRQVGDKVSADVITTTRTTGDRIRTRARDSAPVETGELRRSIKVSRSRSRRNVSVSITAESDHAVFQEFGTTRNRAQPFMRPALLAEVDSFVEDLEEVLRDIL